MVEEKGKVGFLESVFTRQERMFLGLVVGVSLAGLSLSCFKKAFPAPQSSFTVLHVQVNQAGVEELSALPGIGQILAERMVKERKRRGRYLTFSDLARVKGITPKVLAKLKGFVRFD